LLAVANVVPLLGWRAFVWFVKPQWFAGKSKEAGKSD